jgi:hypothetical protein
MIFWHDQKSGGKRTDRGGSLFNGILGFAAVAFILYMLITAA